MSLCQRILKHQWGQSSSKVARSNQLSENLFANTCQYSKSLHCKDLDEVGFGYLSALEFSNNGEFFISAGDEQLLHWPMDKTLRNNKLSKPIQLDFSDEDDFLCLAISSDNRRVLSGSDSGIVFIYDLNEYLKLHQICIIL